MFLPLKRMLTPSIRILRKSNLTMKRIRPRHFSSNDDTIKVTFILQDGEKEVVEAPVGDNLLDVCWDNDIDIEGACGGEMACSTCHMILDEENFEKLPEPEEEEEDMLDLALGLEDTSRLGCQVICSKEIDGIEVKIPEETTNYME